MKAKIGDKVKVIYGGLGARGADNLIGIRIKKPLVQTDFYTGEYFKDSSFFIKIEGEETVWGLGKGYKLEIIKNPEDFKELVGKTIKNATQMKLKGYDDSGYLKLEFSDGTHTVIVASYGSWTEDSADEYPTSIFFDPYHSDLEEVK